MSVYSLLTPFLLQLTPLLPQLLQDKIPTLLHEPLRRAGSTTNANGIDTLQPIEIDFVDILYMVTIGVHSLTLFE